MKRDSSPGHLCQGLLCCTASQTEQVHSSSSLQSSENSQRRKQESMFPGTIRKHSSLTNKTPLHQEQKMHCKGTILEPLLCFPRRLWPITMAKSMLHTLFLNAKMHLIMLFCSLWVTYIFLLRIPRNKEHLFYISYIQNNF